MRELNQLFQTGRSTLLLPFIMLLIVAILPYSNIFPNAFAFDDFDFFIQWEGVKSVSNISSFFSGDLPTYHQHAYRPVRSIMQSVVYALSNGEPFGFHVFSLFTQVAGVILIFLIARKLAEPLTAFVTAIIFAVLPVHTDSITFMTASFDTAGALMGLGSFYLYILYHDSSKWWLYILSLVLALAAFFSYEMTLVLPLFLLMYDYFVKEQSAREIVSRWKTCLPYFIAALFYITVRASIVGTTFTGVLAEPAPFFDRMLTMLKAFVIYIYLTVVGAPLSVIHNVPVESSPFSVKVFLSLVILLGIAAAVVYLFKKGQKLPAFAIVWFFVALLPVSNVIPLSTFLSEHYLYAATFGWALLVGLLFEKYLDHTRSKYGAVSAWVLLCVLIGAYGYVSFDRNFDWRNGETIFNAALALDPNYAGGYNAVAFEYRLKKDYEKAEEYARKALEVNPNYYVSHALLGEIKMEQKLCEEALPYFAKALEINSGYVSGYVNRGACFYELKRFPEAESDFLKALQIFPGYTLAHKNLGVMYAVNGKFVEAISHLEQVVKESEDAGAEHILGVSLLNLGRVPEARERLEKVLRLSPGHTDTIKILEQISQ